MQLQCMWPGDVGINITISRRRHGAPASFGVNADQLGQGPSAQWLLLAAPMAAGRKYTGFAHAWAVVLVGRVTHELYSGTVLLLVLEAAAADANECLCKS